VLRVDWGASTGTPAENTFDKNTTQERDPVGDPSGIICVKAYTFWCV